MKNKNFSGRPIYLCNITDIRDIILAIAKAKNSSRVLVLNNKMPRLLWRKFGSSVHLDCIISVGQSNFAQIINNLLFIEVEQSILDALFKHKPDFVMVNTDYPAFWYVESSIGRILVNFSFEQKNKKVKKGRRALCAL